MPKPPSKGALPQPHDALFRWTFSQREHAVGLLKAALPPELAARVNFGTLQLEKGSFVDAALRSRHSDLVFSARLAGQSIYFYTLVEHQRDVEGMMVFRMGLYMMRLWEQLVRDPPRRKQLPPIMPMLIHHSDTGWTAATAFQDVVAVGSSARPALLPYIPHFELRLIDLSRGRASHLVENALTALGQIVLWCLSVAGDDERLAREIRSIAAALDEVLRAPNGLAALEALLRYLVATHERLGVKNVGKLLQKAAGRQAQEGIVTVLDEIERRGERKGRAQALMEQLAARFGTVPADVIARIDAADEAALARWAVRVLTATTPADVIDEDGGGKRRPSSRKPAASKRTQRAPATKRA